MSAPPTSSPLTNTCGIVGQPEIADSSWRICGSGRMSTAVTGAPARRSACSARSELPHMTNAGVPFMKMRDVRAVDDFLDLVGVAHAGSLRLDPEFVDGAVGQRRRQRLVDAPVLLDERQPVERRRGDDDLEVVAAAGPVDHVELGRVRKRALEQLVATVACSRVDRSEREPVARPDARPRRPRPARSRPSRHAATATRQGRSPRTTSTTSSSRVQKTASIEKRMKNMWIDPPGRNSIPSSGSSDARPSRPFMRASDETASRQRAHTTVPSWVRSVGRLHRTKEHRGSVATMPAQPADVAELVDAHGSGPCARKGVEVQVLSSA